MQIIIATDRKAFNRAVVRWGSNPYVKKVDKGNASIVRIMYEDSDFDIKVIYANRPNENKVRGLKPMYIVSTSDTHPTNTNAFKGRFPDASFLSLEGYNG